MLVAMQATATLEEAPSRAASLVQPMVIAVPLAISFSHLLNDTIQALIPSIYPLLRESDHLTFAQLGWITFTFQCTASLFQPLVGCTLDRKPLPLSLAVGMGLSLIVLLALCVTSNFGLILLSAGMV